MGSTVRIMCGALWRLRWSLPLALALAACGPMDPAEAGTGGTGQQPLAVAVGSAGSWSGQPAAPAAPPQLNPYAFNVLVAAANAGGPGDKPGWVADSQDPIPIHPDPAPSGTSGGGGGDTGGGNPTATSSGRR